MKTSRLEAFSDGVIAIVITIMVLEMKIPHGTTLAELKPLTGTFLSYVLSFVYVGIYWNNHHHLFHITKRVTGSILWANLHLLFWLSLFPFVTGWMGENHFTKVPVALYGFALLMASLAFWVLQWTISRDPEAGELLRSALGKDLKGKISPFLYLSGIGFAFVFPWMSAVLYVATALMWFIPDRRYERALAAAVRE